MLEQPSITIAGVNKVLDLLRDFDYGVRVHFTNIASGKSVEAIKEAQNEGLVVSTLKIGVQ